MLNGQFNDFGSETYLTQIASYFDIVDNAVKTGDTNKRYTITSNVSTAPSPPIPDGSWTNIHIAPTADNMCDLANSYIEVEMKFDATISGTGKAAALGTGNNPSVWIGFKDAMDSIEQYQIVANGQAVYTQPHAIEESFITNLATIDSVRDRDIFQKATARMIYDRPECVMTGGLVEITSGSELPFTKKGITLKLKIDIRRILPLSAIKYLPAFIGNLELRVKFSTAGLVCLPMPLEDFMKVPGNLYKIDGDTAGITTCFTSLGATFNAYLTATETSGVITVGNADLTASVANMTVENCRSHLCCFGIDDGIYQSLIQRYTSQSLSFPTQTLTFQAMNGQMGGSTTATTVDLALTSTPRFVDTIFMLFPVATGRRTCYPNPLFDSFRLTMGGYGSCPDMPISSYGSANYEMLQNALNLNSDIAGVNEDVMRSAILDASQEWDAVSKGFKPNDISNFVLAIPTSTDNTFQQGQTSAAPITYQFKGTLNAKSAYLKSGVNCVPLMGFLKDSIIAIQLRPDGPPIVAIDEYDITSPQGN